jgi:poly-gamma-glutamate capsule biosynthesis protein CapA/YwtB (metallophosphatase superfamily)
VAVCLAAGLAAADAGWKWSGPATDKAVSMLIIGDIDIQLRADPTTAFVHIGDTLNHADLVYANLEGLLVKPLGPTLDIPDKKGWQHPGPDGVKALQAWNIKVVGVANNVAYGRANIMKSLGVLDANGILHTGAGSNIAAAHQPAIIARKGVRIGFLQYTARWYEDREQIATDTEPGIAKIASRDGVTIDPADVARVKDDIRRLRGQADIVVVSHHNRDGATPTQFGAAAAPDHRAPARDAHTSEEYQKVFAHLALDAGADLVYGHGTHTVQGVEVYKGKPILYAIGHSAFDQPGYEKSKDGLVIHAVVQDKALQRVSFVPVTRDAHNDVLMLDPSTGEGARLLQIIKGESAGIPLKIEGEEVVLIDRAPQMSRK